ncbi:uncharacterized protein LOC130721935 [Lotus japonicus]|uniref:uncharacterized protein LOC130721935 n=1 Tax=Lotus japonicus TaxID=34305 RepID=UPI00258C59AF|nr:uncharacterized protein LOC130721935 [Lotus japonicus]
MASTIIKLFSLVILVVLLANANSSKAQSSTTESTISASPGVLPYETSPDISSFFPTPSSEAEASASAPAPSSGELDGKKSSSSARLGSAATFVGILLSRVLIINMVNV